eukprot:232661-Chlamydomonas_euryale.AAC.2
MVILPHTFNPPTHTPPHTSTPPPGPTLPGPRVPAGDARPWKQRVDGGGRSIAGCDAQDPDVHQAALPVHERPMQ